MAQINFDEFILFLVPVKRYIVPSWIVFITVWFVYFTVPIIINKFD